jgi:hypothetical protein
VCGRKKQEFFGLARFFMAMGGMGGMGGIKDWGEKPAEQFLLAKERCVAETPDVAWHRKRSLQA